MITLFFSAVLFLHGLVHLPVWLAPVGGSEPFDPRHSWASAAAGVPGPRLTGAAAIVLASVTTLLYVIAGAATATRSGGWPTAALVAACAGLLLKAVWFDPWLIPGVLLDAGVVAAALSGWPASSH
ncbi:hypothetical protein ACFY93_11170 [Streptomyces sp. NPDC008313]|uniref:hypothetical protein n=1 Tax=Streptomyces sp. NPDC008313 TaxID=3364826 RepID=UPI0036EF120D